MTKRSLSFLSLLLLLVGSIAPAGAQSTHPYPKSYFLLAGTYGPADSNSIFVYRFNPSTGGARWVGAVKGIENPSFINFSPDHRFLYAVSETHGGKGGSVFAYSFNRNSGALRVLNSQLSQGDDPCNITTDHTGRWLFVANYSSGSFTLFPLGKDGRIGPASRNIQDHGHGFNPQRQEGPHVHCVLVAPNNRDVFVSDLGLDRLFTYELDPATGHLVAGNPPYATVVPGRGPRLPIFSNDHRYVYLIQEMGGTITQFDYHSGKLTTVATVSTIPAGYSGTFTGADLHCSPDGKFLYASNRDALNDLVWFRIDPKNGHLSFAGSTSSLGKTPRYFLITPDGRFVLVGHQNSGDIVVFRRDVRTGNLTPTPERIPVAHAVCLQLVPEGS
ncbi:MAG TPA: lactonase family protein [Chitinophagaceae bacterium]|nr:lactonase family protein [Chitinophagaceae bacterium]HVB02638.1 lactonase family protein [Chitinophagaceae bacterium]